jgi:predicted alpha/beta superfamily hydrolase
MSETLRSTLERIFRRENRRTHIRRGHLEYINDFESTYLEHNRDVTIYLPAGYADSDSRRYPVIYMHDGQNLFEAHRAFIPGQHWRLSDAADAAIGARKAAPMIIVGIDNAGAARIDEYTPTPDPRHKAGGRADDHARMIIEELKPLIDTTYRTRPDPENTAIGGSSLGGLAALYLALHHNAVFRSAAVMSPSVWWNNRVILEELDKFRGSRPRIWLDIGGREGRDALNDVRALRDRLQERGWDNFTLRYYEDRRGDHSERAWAARAQRMLEFLFPPA